MNHTEDDRSVKRRHVLRATGVGILAGLALAPPATATPKRGAELTDQEVALVLQVARLGAVYPVPFPDFGEAGPAASRATAERLRARLPELGAGRLQLVRDGARDLVAAGLTGASRDRLLDGLGRATAKTWATAKNETAKNETAKNETAKNETAKNETAKNGAAVKNEAEPARELVALTALAVATVSKSFSPHDDAAAVFWLGGLRQRHLRLNVKEGGRS